MKMLDTEATRTEVTNDLQAVRSRIEQFDFETNPLTRGMVERIARDNGWSMRFTRRAVAEYRRFCVLAVDAKGGVSPSEVVDEVWHTHLLYTRSYWGDWCPHVLNLPLHHVPNSGAAGEGESLNDLYARTLRRYEAVFGEKPPADLWPPPGTPHARKLHADLSRHLVFPRPPKVVIAIALAALIAIVALVAMGAAPVPVPPPAVQAPLADLGFFDMTGPHFMVFYAVATVVAFGAAGLIRLVGRRSKVDADLSYTPEPYELAYLGGGDHLALSAAVATLAGRKEVKPAGGKLSIGGGPGTTRHPLEAVVLTQLGDGRPQSFRKLLAAARPALDDLRAGLQERGLVPDTGTSVSIRMVSTAVALSVSTMGLIKIAIGLSRNKPVAFLVVFVIFTVFFGIGYFAPRIRRTTAGDKVIRNMKTRIPREDILGEATVLNSGRLDLQSAGPGRFAMAGYDPLVIAMALYGTSVLADTDLEPIRSIIQPVSAGDGGGSSSGCSGGGSCGGGGGCGGCSS